MPGIQNSHRLTAVVDKQVFDLHAHEDVILQPRDVAVPDVEVPDGVLLLLDHVGIDLEKATNKPWFSVPGYPYSNLSWLYLNFIFKVLSECVDMEQIHDLHIF